MRTIEPRRDAKGSYVYHCELCGFRMTLPAKKRVRHNCQKAGAGGCIYFGEATGTIELVQCETCQGNVRIKRPVHYCSVFTACLPKTPHDNSSGLAGCVDCPDRVVAPKAG